MHIETQPRVMLYPNLIKSETCTERESPHFTAADMKPLFAVPDL